MPGLLAGIVAAVPVGIGIGAVIFTAQHRRRPARPFVPRVIDGGRQQDDPRRAA